jgi:hypothetical protein
MNKPRWQPRIDQMIAALELAETEDELVKVTESFMDVVNSLPSPSSRKKPLSLARKAISDNFSDDSFKLTMCLKSLQKTTMSENPMIELTAETHTLLLSACEETGTPSDVFLKSAIENYAKMLIGKKQSASGIQEISTYELMNNPKYKTMPKRAEEIVRRAIKAIKIYNSEVATGHQEKWGITQTTLFALTGANVRSIATALEQWQDDIKSYNESNHLDSRTHNRKPVKITEVINLPELVPDGVD